jgi:hypothetical protein
MVLPDALLSENLLGLSFLSKLKRFAVSSIFQKPTTATPPRRFFTFWE